MKLSPRYDGPTILSFDGPADDQLSPVTRQRRRMEALLANLTEQEWRSASRCEGWTVHDVVSHLVGVNTFWAASVRAGLEDAPTRVLASFDPVAHPPLMVDAMRALSPREVLDQFVASNDAFLDAVGTLDEHGWSTLAESPAGHVSIRLLAHHALWDAWVHERDIVFPLGRTPAEEPDELRSCLRYAAALGPALALSGSASFAGEFVVSSNDPDMSFTVEVTDVVVVHDGPPRTNSPCLRGAAANLVEALSLRAPLPADVPVEWSGLVNGLAKVFDTDLR
jgi:uncharacterized protein (TIGR03083 family)